MKRRLIIDDHEITDDSPPFVVAEIGSNHCGDLEMAKKMIKTAADCGADAVKFQKRDNAYMFTKAMLEKPYNNDFSLGATYGEHREKLDWFGIYDYIELREVAKINRIMMFATPFEIKSANFLRNVNIPLYKIASCDITNIPLIKHVAGFGRPMLISTGGASWDDIDRVYEALKKINFYNFAFLYCVATYPNTDEDLNLCQISEMRELYPDILIGFSSHHSGLDPVKEAYFQGARIFEVHFTLNRGFRGTDHGFSLEPGGLSKLCEDLKRIQIRLGIPERKVLAAEQTGFCYKMGKAIHVARFIPAGKRIEPQDIAIKSPADGLPPYEEDAVLGKTAIHDLSTSCTLTWEDLK